MLLVCFALGLLAQENRGRIIGTVTDQTGAAIPDAKIVATSPTLPRGLETTSDSSGGYALLNVPIGTYAITVSKTGFATIRQQGVAVNLGAQVDYNPKLEVGQVSEIVEVSDSAISLDTTSSRTSTNIPASQFETFAKGRTFNSILALAPGVRSEVKSGNAGVGGIQVDGASGSENAYFIDGVDVSNVRRGSLDQQSAIPLDFVAEVQVKSGGFEAEFGGATGGVVNVATRGGSNEFHGEGWFEGTGNSLNAGDRGYWKLSPANADLADFFKPKEDDYHIFYPGFRVGGPILKDRLFFLAGFNPEVEKTTREVNYASGSRTFEQSIKRFYSLARVDYAPTQKLQINTSYIWSPYKRTGTLPDRDARIAAPSNDLSIQGGYRPAQAYTAAATFTPTNRLVFSARYGYRYYNDKIGNYGLSGEPYLTYQTSSLGLAGVPTALQGGTGFRNVTSTLATERDITTRNNVYLDASYVIGNHTFKGGYQLSRLANDVETDYTNGRFLVYWDDVFSRGSVTNQRGTYGYYTWEDGVRNLGSVNSRNQGFYVQDQWRVSNRLTLNLGVRFENEFLPPFKAEVNGVKVSNPVSFGWGDKVAPRLGAAWDMLGDGKWKLSGSYGIFYDVLKYELARGSFGSDIWVSHVYRLDSPNVSGLSKTNPGALGPEIVSYNNRTLPINDQGQIEGIDPDIKPYQAQEFTVNLEHALASRLVAAVRYSHKDLLRAIEDIGVLDGDDEVYLTGNPGYGLTRDTSSAFGGKTPNGENFLVPKAKRQYDGVEFRVQGQTNRFLYIASYTYSRLYGNYAGAANSDESGRSDPGVSRAYDLPFYYFTSDGTQKPAYGRLGTDRPHTFKLYGSYDLKTKIGSTNFGLNQIAYSGTPDTTSVIYQSAPTFPNGRGDMGRTPVLTQTDILVSHTIPLGETARIRLDANIVNLFNQAAVISRVTQINRTSAITASTLPLDQFFGGYNLSDYVKPGSTTPPYNPMYFLPGGNYRSGGGPGVDLSSAFAASFPNFGAYQDFRTIRLGVRFIF